jgi:hypothetical protein
MKTKHDRGPSDVIIALMGTIALPASAPFKFVDEQSGKVLFWWRKNYFCEACQQNEAHNLTFRNASKQNSDYFK